MWTDLKAKAAAVAGRHMLDLFETNPTALRISASRRVTCVWTTPRPIMDDESRDALLALAEAAGWQAKRDAMFAGAAINETEGRAVLHTALRNLDGGRSWWMAQM